MFWPTGALGLKWLTELTIALTRTQGLLGPIYCQTCYMGVLYFL